MNNIINTIIIYILKFVLWLNYELINFFSSLNLLIYISFSQYKCIIIN
jgi:hypothetical protein